LIIVNNIKITEKRQILERNEQTVFNLKRKWELNDNQKLRRSKTLKFAKEMIFSQQRTNSFEKNKFKYPELRQIDNISRLESLSEAEKKELKSKSKFYN